MEQTQHLRKKKPLYNGTKRRAPNPAPSEPREPNGFSPVVDPAVKAYLDQQLAAYRSQAAVPDLGDWTEEAEAGELPIPAPKQLIAGVIRLKLARAVRRIGRATDESARANHASAHHTRGCKYTAMLAEPVIADDGADYHVIMCGNRPMPGAKYCKHHSEVMDGIHSKAIDGKTDAEVKELLARKGVPQ